MLRLIVLSLSHFEFIFVYGANREFSNFIDSHVNFPLFQHRFLKRLCFLHCVFLPPCLYIN